MNGLTIDTDIFFHEAALAPRFMAIDELPFEPMFPRAAQCFGAASATDGLHFPKRHAVVDTDNATLRAKATQKRQMVECARKHQCFDMLRLYQGGHLANVVNAALQVGMCHLVYFDAMFLKFLWDEFPADPARDDGHGNALRSEKTGHVDCDTLSTAAWKLFVEEGRMV